MNELRQKHKTLKIILEVVGLAKSTYYDYINQNHKQEDQELLDLIYDIWLSSRKTYGYRRITLRLKRLGNNVNHKRVKRIMTVLGIKGEIRSRKYKSYKGETGKIAENLLNREFNPKKLRERFVTDITEFKVAGRKVYLSPLIDLYNREVVSYSISLSPNTNMVLDMLKGAENNFTNNTMIHSDQGTQYQSIGYQRYLERHNITLSMSRKGNCYDNSLAENFFSHVKTELFYRNKFKTVKQFILKLIEYIKYYNEERIITKLKMSPVEYREHCLI